MGCFKTRIIAVLNRNFKTVGFVMKEGFYFSELRNFYGDKLAGISLHEEPNEYLSGSIGYSMGAKIFEKHIGVSKGSIILNKYSYLPTEHFLI